VYQTHQRLGPNKKLAAPLIRSVISLEDERPKWSGGPLNHTKLRNRPIVGVSGRLKIPIDAQQCLTRTDSKGWAILILPRVSGASGGELHGLDPESSFDLSRLGSRDGGIKRSLAYELLNEGAVIESVQLAAAQIKSEAKRLFKSR